MAASPIVNALTIDVEDYFQVSAFAPYVSRSSWDGLECRVEGNVQRILQLLADHGARATFFTLGWIAQRYPGVVRDIVAAGHELASHGHGHERVSDLTPETFLADLRQAKTVLEQTGGVEVVGYRAPSFSIGRGNLWAFDVLAETGHRYSSSIYPIRHDHYGMPESPRFPYYPRADLLEVPITTVRAWGQNFPSSGGGYFRLLPYAVSRWMLRRVNDVDGRPGVFYFHPWEIDDQQPRVQGVNAKARFRHYVNIERMEGRLRRLLRDFRWGRMDEVFLADAGQRHPSFALAA